MKFKLQPMRCKMFKMTLRKKIVVFIIFVAIYPIILLGILGYYNYEKIIKERFVAYSQNDMNQLVKTMDSEMLDMSENVRQILADNELQAILKERQNSESTTINTYNIKRRTENYLRSTLYSLKDFDLAAIYFPSENTIYYSEEKTGYYDATDFPTTKIVENLTDNVGGNVLLKDEKVNRTDFFFAREILDKDTFRSLGILIFKVDPQYFQETLNRTYTEDGKTTYLISDVGNQICYRGSNQAASWITLTNYYNKADGISTKTVDGDNYYIITQKVTQLQSVLISVITTEILLADLRKATDLIMILFLITIPLYLFLGNLIYQSIVSPVSQLIGSMEQFEKGELSVSIESKRKDEMGYLFRAFNKMSHNINRLVNEVYKEELARKDAEIAALQEQMNPHFLYNTLESINWRAQLAGEADIAKMIQALSKLMDGSMNREDLKYNTVENEVYYMEQYMYLIQMRFGESIQYVTEIEESVKLDLLPKLIIQPLLENAVKHGIEPVGEGTIYLKIFLDKGLNIIVEDTGNGMNYTRKEMVRRMLTREKVILAEEHQRKSIGLQNVSRRLHLIYGNDVSIDLTSEVNKGTKIWIKIPEQKAEIV